MIYLLDDSQLAVLKRVESRLYDEMTRLSPDDRRDLANAMNAVRHSVETLGDVEAELAARSLAARLAAFDEAIALADEHDTYIAQLLREHRDGEQ